MEIDDLVKFIPHLVYFANQMFFEDDSDEEDRVQEDKIDNFVEDIVPKFNDKQFKRHFRINPTSFENIFVKIHNVIPPETHRGQPQISTEKQLLLTIWYLANIESFRSVAQRFNVTKSTAWMVVTRVGKWILAANTRFKFISWPSADKALESAHSFENINGFPGVIGCIDGTHVKILAPKQHANSYYNRKKFHSVILQGVCNEKKMFIDVFAGIPGSCHDARVYQMSQLQHRVEFPNDTHLIGDLAYPLSKTMMVGFKDHGNLSNRQKNYNNKLSQIRLVIEQAFALLKGRFRRLKFVETIRLEFICLFIVVGCILHNLCILNADNADDIINIGEELMEERINQVIEAGNEARERNRQEAVMKRNLIMHNLRLQL